MNLGSCEPLNFHVDDRDFCTRRSSRKTQPTYCAPIHLKVLLTIRPRVTTANMRLTTDLINNSLSFINCLTERELDLRGTLERTDTTLAS